MNLKPCPCGQTPKQLFITQGDSLKYAYVSSYCCGKWRIMFETNYYAFGSVFLMNLAIQAWNDAPRGCSKKGCQQRDLLTEKLGDRKNIDSPDSDLIYPND